MTSVVSSPVARRATPWLTVGTILLTLITLITLLVIMSGEEGPVGPGSVLSAFQTATPDGNDMELRLRGSLALGVTILSLALIFGGYRHGHRWAWYALWFWPVFFSLHIVAFGTVMPDAILAALAVIALLLPVRTFFD
jgi:hypothetical protein